MGQYGKTDDRPAEHILKEIIDRMNTNICVTDVETNQILFMNKTMREDFCLSTPEGRYCWQVLEQGKTGRCDCCPVPTLLEQGEQASFTWEGVNTLNGRTYENCDSLMRWTDGRLAHIQYSVDVTRQRELAVAASRDELTGIYNRRAGKELLDRVQARSFGRRELLSVCMLDVNGLKAVNDKHGHLEGDKLLIRIAQEVCGVLDGEDFLMRLSGDEFLAVFPGKDSRQASRRMDSALHTLRELRLYPGTRRGEEFCYGVVQLPEDKILSVSEILAQADEKLYEQKRMLHIQRATDRLRWDRAAGDGDRFTYDKDRLYDALADSTDDYIYVCNMKTGTFRYPPAMVEEFGLPGQVVENAAAVWVAKVHEHDKKAFLESNQEILDGRTDMHCIEYRAKNCRGEWVWLRCRGHVERNERGEPVLFAGMITNLGKRNQIDHLTGLWSKYEFEQVLRQQLQQPERTPGAMMLLDVDNFKQINNLYDRKFGDEVLRIISQKIQVFLPPGASLYRLDGDEFGVVFRGGTRGMTAAFFDSLREAFQHQQTYDGKKFFCTVSGGCAFYPQDAVSYQDLVKSTAYAMDYAKRCGKDRLAFFSADILAVGERALRLTEALRDSVENNFSGFFLQYQPVYRSDGSIAGAETLARWKDDSFGPVGPSEFIPLLEESGLIGKVGRWILEEALQTMRTFVDIRRDMLLGVNLSYLQMEETDLPAFIKGLLKRYNVPGEQLVLELTESSIAENLSEVSGRLMELRGIGALISMDDFGTGYSSPGILRQLPINIVKIDRTFIHGIQNNAFDSEFIRLVSELCHSVGIRTCLEGVETTQEYQAAKELGLDYLQGYLLSRPMDESACRELLQTQGKEGEN